jgi:hypothetical protein
VESLTPQLPCVDRPQRGREGGLSRRALLLAGGAAFLARLAAVLLLGSDDPTAGAYEHAEIAREIAAGNGFRFAFYGPPEPSSHQAPLVAWTLAGLYLLFGTGSPAAHLSWQVLASLGGAAAAVLIALAGSRLERPRLGLLAGLAAALHPPLVYAPTRIQSINFTIPGLAALLWLSLRCRADLRPRRAALLGAAGGLFMLADPIVGAPLAALVGWLSVAAGRLDGWRAATRTAGAALVAAAAVLSPWTARNFQVHGRLVPVKDSVPYVFWQGNNPKATGTDKLLPAAESIPASGALAPAVEEAELSRLRLGARSLDRTLPAGFVDRLRAAPDEIRRMDLFAARGRKWLVENPGGYLRLCARRVLYLLWFDATNPRSYSLYYRASYLALLALAAPGLALALFRRAWVPVHLAFLAQGAVLVLVITSARFRLPLEALAILPAALSVETLWSLAAGRSGCRAGN